jgi:hypothetical protein
MQYKPVIAIAKRASTLTNKKSALASGLSSPHGWEMAVELLGRLHNYTHLFLVSCDRAVLYILLHLK